MEDLKDLSEEKLVDLGITHPDDIDDIFECIEDDYMWLLRSSLYNIIENAGYDMYKII